MKILKKHPSISICCMRIITQCGIDGVLELLFSSLLGNQPCACSICPMRNWKGIFEAVRSRLRRLPVYLFFNFLRNKSLFCFNILRRWNSDRDVSTFDLARFVDTELSLQWPEQLPAFKSADVAVAACGETLSMSSHPIVVRLGVLLWV